MKSKAAGCGSIATVFSSMVLLCVNNDNNNNNNNNNNDNINNCNNNNDNNINNSIITEYQRIINLIDNRSLQPSKFRTRKRIKINDD